MFCEKCGKQINDDAVFCPFCGYNMNTLTETKSQPEIINPTHSDMNSKPLIQNVASTKQICLGICFAVFAVLELLFWYSACVVQYGEYETSYAIVAYWFRADSAQLHLKSILLLLGSIVNILFAIHFFSGKTILYKVAVIYGIVSSVIIHFSRSYEAIMSLIMPDPNPELSQALTATSAPSQKFFSGLGIVASVLILFISVLLFVFLFMLPRAQKTWQIIITYSLAVIYGIAFLLSYTTLFRELRTWKVSDMHVPFIISIITTLYGIVMYSILIWSVHKQAIRQKC